MRRIARLGSWRRGVVKLGLLAGVGVALVGGQPGRVGAGPMPCQLEGKCTLKKPRLMFVAEYSAAMNQPLDDQLTRWEAVAEAIEAAVDFDNGYVAENFILGLLRFGSDPEPMVPDTAIDGTGLVDGVALDVAWYDPQDPQKSYRECTVGDEIVATLDDLPPPPVGIGSWARGGLLFTKGYLASSDADHPLDAGKRRGVVVLLSAGVWTDPAGTKKLGPASEHPKLAAGELFTELGVPTYVVNVGGAAGKLVSDPVALAGGTEQVLPGEATELAGVEALSNALKGEILKAQNDVVVPVCQPSFPRVMLLVDGSSAMLNVDGVKAGPGLGPWEQVREALTGPAGLLDALLVANLSLETMHVLGLSTFGGAINYITRTPSMTEYSGKLSASGANFGESDISASFEGPIIDDKLAFRIGGRYYNRGAVFTARDGGGLGEENSKSINLTFVAKPVEGLEVKLRGFHAQDEDGPSMGGIV